MPDARDRARDGELLFGNIDTWLIWKLTNGAVHVTDPSNASRTMLMNLATGDWDDGLLAHLRRAARHAAAHRAVERRGRRRPRPEHWAREIPDRGNRGRSAGGAGGQACFRPGLSKNTYGTGCFALMHTGAHAPVSKNRLLATRAASHRRAAAVRDRRQRLHRRRGGAVAARQVEAHRHRGGIGSPGGVGSR